LIYVNLRDRTGTPRRGRGILSNRDLRHNTAKEVLIASGWLPKCGETPEGPKCILNAIGDSMWNQHVSWEEADPRIQAMTAALAEAAGVVGHPARLADWNDTQTSIEAIIAVFDRAIETAVKFA